MRSLNELHARTLHHVGRNLELLLLRSLQYLLHIRNILWAGRVGGVLLKANSSDEALVVLKVGLDSRHFDQQSDECPSRSNQHSYFQIAQQYGYANYFFQTNQGPSFEAHQFLFTGSSAPTNPSDLTTCTDSKGNSYPCYEWFAAELLTSGEGYGCATKSTVIPDIDPSGNEANAYNDGFPCYNHNSLATLLDANSISWKYYTQSGANSLWTGPNAIQAICYPLTANDQSCDGYDWTNYVAKVFPNSPAYPNSYSPILTDLGADPNQQQCALPAVSWVVPDGNWSDHAGLDPDGSGPAWVAAIVDAVGGYNNTGGQNPISCYDVINGKKVPYWQDTVILVTWDDWGGWYDHILPWRCNSAGVCSGYPGGPDGGGSEYVYGFRVPLLVVSAYNYRPQGSTGYLSGACGQAGQPACPNEQQQYIHDFGSILNFIEYAFGTGGNPLGGTGGISPSYPYADVFAPDGPAVCKSNCPHPYSLSDFFNFNSGPTTFAPFTQGINYRTQCFLTPSVEDCFGASFAPADPDDDAVD
jgi:hypothetical protein